MVSHTLVREELSKGADISLINLVQGLVEDARARDASDIHIDPEEEKVRVRFRIDGVLQDAYSLPKTIHFEVISRIKVLSGLRTDEHQTAQDGRFRATLASLEPIDIRVCIAPTYHGENAVLRLLAPRAEEFLLETLGFSEMDQKKIEKALARPYGMVLSTGPTGSGKTTTLYTLLKLLNTKEVSIVTVEDPIEYAVAGVKQIQVNPNSGLTFASGLRSILRQDPNVIMVGEIRDSETASIAVNTALTGHLLLSTLHTIDAATTLPRLLDMGVEPFLVASTVNIAIGQRLVRKICSSCKSEKQLNQEEKARIKETLPTLSTDRLFFEGSGCDDCGGTGYRGRISINEVLEVDNYIREAILRKDSASEVRRIATENGMVPLVHDGIAKVERGVTTLTELFRVIHE